MKTPARIAFLIVFAVLAAAPACAQYYHIDFKNFPETAAYRKHVEEFFSIYKYVNHWTPEWKYDVPKTGAIATLEALLKETGDLMSAQKSDQVDLALFHALLRTCLYNLDSGAQHPAVIAELEALEQKFPKDYRAPWLLGNFYVYAGDAYNGIRQFDYIFENIFLDRMAADVVVDYIAAAHLALMYATCLNVVDGLAADNHLTDPNKIYPRYDQVKALLKPPAAGAVIPAREVFTFYERDKDNGFLSRLFGVWLPMKDDWSVRPLEARADGSGGLVITIPLTSAAGRRINVTALALFQAQPGESFDDFMKRSSLGLKNITPYTPSAGAGAFQAFEYRDPDRYRANGGARGFLVFVKRGQPKVKGRALEAPSRLPKPKKSGPAYYQEQEGYTRFDGDIHYCFLLDSCEAVFEESQREFFGFLDKILLD